MRLYVASTSTLAFIALCFFLAFHMASERARGDQPVAMKVDAPAFEGIEEWLNGKTACLERSERPSGRGSLLDVWLN
ncbi:MAG: hypothetical protein ACJ8FY_22820 [Gemmataceae bacterium]